MNPNANFYVLKQQIAQVMEKKNPTLLKHHIITMHELFKAHYYVNDYIKLFLENYFTRQTNSKYLKILSSLGIIDIERSSCFKVKHTENFPKTGKEWASAKKGFTQFTVIQMQYIYAMDSCMTSLYVNLQLIHEANFSKPFVTSLYSLESKTGICRKTILKKLKYLDKNHLISLVKLKTNDAYDLQKYEITFRKFDTNVNEIPSEMFETSIQDVNEIPSKCYPDSTEKLTGFHQGVNEIPTIKELVLNNRTNDLNNRVIPHESEIVKEKPKKTLQNKINLIWESYEQGIEKKYGVKPTVSNMAITKSSLKRLLTLEWVRDYTHVIELIKFYLESDDKFYENQLHSMAIFVRQAGEINTKQQFRDKQNTSNDSDTVTERRIRNLWGVWGDDFRKEALEKHLDICKKLGVA